MDDLRAHNVPLLLEEQRVDAIRAMSFSWFKGEDNLLDFLGSGGGVKMVVVLMVQRPFGGGVIMESNVRG